MLYIFSFDRKFFLMFIHLFGWVGSHVACGTSPLTRIKPEPPVLGALSLSSWATSLVPTRSSLT